MRRFWLVALLVATGGWDALRAPDPDVDQGNEAFKAGRFDEALDRYRSAETRGADPRLHFDMGAALYKLGEKTADQAAQAKLLQQAEEQFRRAADSDDVQLKSLAYFNLGNSMYQRQQWEDAVSAYKRALRANPNNEPARHNLEMALRQRDKQDKQDKQQGQKDQKGQKQDQKQDKQGGQGQGQKDQQDPQNGQGKQDPKDGQPGQQDKDQDQQPQGGQPQGAQPPEQQQQQSRGEHRPEDQKRAEREAEERRQQQQREQQQRQQQPPDDGNAGTDSPTDQDRKLDELERRSRELRKRLLRQGGKNRDPLHLPSRRDW
jgi:Ca-activated chloride channel family protein